MLFEPSPEEGSMAGGIGYKVDKVDPEAQGSKEVVSDREEI